MRYSGIGGQAVMEGVMMKNQDRYAVAVRKPDGEICAQTFDYPGLVKNKTLKNAPVIRGVLNFIDSLVLGMRSLTYSASFFEEEDKKKKEEDPAKAEKKEKKRNGDHGSVLCHRGSRGIYGVTLLSFAGLSPFCGITDGTCADRGCDPACDLHRLYPVNFLYGGY